MALPCSKNTRPFALRVANVLKGSIKAFRHYDSDHYFASKLTLGMDHTEPQTTDKPHYKNNSSSKCINLLATFSLQEEGAKKKLSKRNAEREISPSADGEEAYAASTAPPFEKGGRKLFDKR